MKKLLYLLSIIFLLLQSCSSSSESSNNNNSLLLNRWYFVSGTDDNGTTVYPINCDNGHRDYVDFLLPNIANFYHVESSTGNNCSDQYVLETFNWIKNGNTLNFSYNGSNVSTCVITELTNTSLKFIETDLQDTHPASLQVYSAN